MTRIAHIADLHLGAADRRVFDTCADMIHNLEPEAIIVAGDLTQRGKQVEFEAARAWLDQFSLPTLSVPGNHDTPLLNPVTRMTGAFDRYDEYFSHWSRPLQLRGVHVSGLNTARGWQVRANWAEGRVNLGDLEALASFPSPDDATRIIVTHHPFMSLAGAPLTTSTKRGMRASLILAESPVPVLLCGHVHMPCTEIVRSGGGAYLAITAGTLSNRLRSHPPAFNIVDVDQRRIAVENYSLQNGAFNLSGQHTWALPELELMRS